MIHYTCIGDLTIKSKIIKMSKQIHDNRHLTLNESKIIQTGIENCSNKFDIARAIVKS